MKIWSSGKNEETVRPSTYYGSAIFVAFSLVVLGTAHVMRDLKLFVACFAAGAAIVAIMCYFAIVATIARRKKRVLDLGSPVGYAVNHRVGTCPDTHLESEGICKQREEVVTYHGGDYKIGQNTMPKPNPNEPAASLFKNGKLNVLDLHGMSTETLNSLCNTFKDHPYTALNVTGKECAR